MTTPKKPTFNFRQTSQWRSVDTRTTMIIAHRCSQGVNFSGCSKSHIIESMAKGSCGYKTDPEKFVGMMNETAKFLPRMKTSFDRDVKNRLDALEMQLAPE